MFLINKYLKILEGENINIPHIHITKSQIYRKIAGHKMARYGHVHEKTALQYVVYHLTILFSATDRLRGYLYPVQVGFNSTTAELP
jgi:hypothetical protein